MYDISIHALVKRATIASDSNIYGGFYFNPRPRKEGDQANTKNLKLHRISIHALVKRATNLADIDGIMQMNFNPRPRKEGDKS